MVDVYTIKHSFSCDGRGFERLIPRCLMQDTRFTSGDVQINLFHNDFRTVQMNKCIADTDKNGMFYLDS